MPLNAELTFSDLKDLTGYTRAADVERCLKRQGVPVFIGKNGPFTTHEALNQALGIRQNEQLPDKIEF